jgi:endonuclease/exonuclease/phosphatase family metal-dependent hydrolase
MAGAWPAGQEKEGKKPVRLRVLSYNIHHGEGLDKKIDLERLARVIRAAEPDLVALQEVDRNTKRSGGVDQPRELGRLTGLKEIFERNIPFQGGDYGNAVLTRLPVKRHRNHALPSFYKGEQRGVLEVELAAPGTDAAFVFLATHLDYRPKDEERLASVKFIEDLLRNRAEVPVVLAGDLNAQPDSAVLKAFRQGWHVTGVSDKLFTFPAEKPTRQIDYVLVRPARRWHVVEVRVLDEPVASDHRPILAVLELR